jgi:hypothetical protein
MGGTAEQQSRTAAIFSVAELSEEAAALMRAELHPQEYVAVLMDKTLFPDAVRFMAHALPKREAVWWAWRCARRVSGAQPPLAVEIALNACEKWLKQPNEDSRRAAMAAAEKAEFSTSAGCAALAAFFSGGSLAPPDAPAVPPGEYLTAKAVAGSVILAAVSREPEKAPEKFRSFMAQALEVTSRIKLWD